MCIRDSAGRDDPLAQLLAPSSERYDYNDGNRGADPLLDRVANTQNLLRTRGNALCEAVTHREVERLRAVKEDVRGYPYRRPQARRVKIRETCDVAVVVDRPDINASLRTLRERKEKVPGVQPLEQPARKRDPASALSGKEGAGPKLLGQAGYQRQVLEHR